MAKAVGHTIARGGVAACQSCAEAKAKQKNVNTVKPDEAATEKATEIHGRICLDTSSIKMSDLVRLELNEQRKSENGIKVVKFPTVFSGLWGH